MRFLLSRRWVAFAIVVAVLTYVAYALGVWQFHRLDARQLENSVLAVNLAADPVPIEDALSVGRAPEHDQEWQRVEATGRWDESSTVIVKYQTRDGEPGVDVVTPLLLGGGRAVLVNRGWLEADNTGASTPDPPAAGEGRVEVTGFVRADATGSAATVAGDETRAVSSARIGETLPYPVLGGWLELDAQDPAPSQPLAEVILPDDTSEGPHFFYGLQWWFFGALAVFGFGYLAYDERRGGERRELMRERRAAAASRTTGRREAKAQEAEQLAAWRYGEREDRPASHR